MSIYPNYYLTYPGLTTRRQVDESRREKNAHNFLIKVPIVSEEANTHKPNDSLLDLITESIKVYYFDAATKIQQRNR